MQNIDIINTVPHLVSDTSVIKWMPSLQKYIDSYLIPAWGFSPTTLHFVPSGHKGDPSCWWIVLNSHSDVDGALGYHDVQPSGLPYARIFVGDDLKYGASVTVTLTHELAEMLGDPGAQQTVDVNNDGKRWMHELCDAVEEDDLAIDVDGMACSNFVLPAYFGGGETQGGPYDQQGKLSGKCPTMMPGGYMDYVDASGQYHQVTARLADGSRSYRSGRSGRSQKRATKA